MNGLSGDDLISFTLTLYCSLSVYFYFLVYTSRPVNVAEPVFHILDEDLAFHIEYLYVLWLVCAYDHFFTNLLHKNEAMVFDFVFSKFIHDLSFPKQAT